MVNTYYYLYGMIKADDIEITDKGLLLTSTVNAFSERAKSI